MAIPLDARAFWPKDHSGASGIPAGWSRDEDFDDRFLQGDPTAGTDGGATTHDHGGTTDPHQPTGNPHSHSLTISGTSSGTLGRAVGSAQAAGAAHTHAAATSVAATETYQNTSATISTTAQIVAFGYVIVIKPDTAHAALPVDAVVFTDDTSPPGDFELTDGNNSTMDLRSRLLRSPAFEDDGGGTGGGEGHTHTSAPHNHTPDGHVHSDSPFSAASTSAGLTLSPLLTTVSDDGPHHSATSIQSATGPIGSGTVVFDNADNIPAFHRLLGIQNRGASAHTPIGVIVPFVGTTIPQNWLVCDGTHGTPNLTAVQVQVTTVGGSVGGTGGSNTHIHTNSAHAHSGLAGSHTHTYTFSNTVALEANTAGFNTAAIKTHTHTSHAMSQVGTSEVAQSVTVPTVDGRYSYRTVKFIKYMGEPAVFYGAAA